MITPQMEERSKLIRRDIEQSDLEADEKANFIELIESSKDSCNGVSQEQKIQGIAENQFASSIILAKIMMLLRKDRATSWKDVAIKALSTWKTVAIIGIIVTLFLFRPEIAGLLSTIGH